MHRSCAGTGQETIGWRQKREIADLRAELAGAQEAARRLRGDLRAKIDILTGRCEAVESKIDQDRETFRIERERLEREISAARAEIAKRTPAGDIPPSPHVEEQLDATETRFSLLEFD